MKFRNIKSILAVLILEIIIQISANERVKREDKLIATTILSYPYYMHKSGNEYEGYIVDLLDKIKEKTNLTFQVNIVADGKYGTLDANGVWNGMVGELIEGKASVAAAPLTVNDQRKTVLDFTTPFMNVKLSLILLKPVNNVDWKIHSAKDLADQTDVKCGVIRGGSTSYFFNVSTDPIYKKINQLIHSDPNNLVNSQDEGIAKVRKSNGKFGLITESVTAEYFSGKPPCDLVSVAIVNDDRSYAMAVKKGSHIKATLDTALEQLKSGGSDSELERLKKKWWKSDCPSGSSAPVEFQSFVMLVVVCLISLVLGI